MTFLRSIVLHRAVIAIAALAFGAVAPAKADFVLDTFNAPTPATTFSITSAGSNPYTSPTVAVAPGLNRTVVVTAISGLGGSSSAATGNMGAGTFELSTTAAVTATAQVNYNYTTAQNFTSLGVSGLTLKFTFADLNIPFSVVLTDSVGGTRTFTSTAVTGPGSYPALLSSFTGSGNLSSISGIDVFLNRNIVSGLTSTSADFILDEITVQNSPTPPAVPAPAAALLALAALPVLGARKLFRKTVAA